jgi:hypothetical protein
MDLLLLMTMTVNVSMEKVAAQAKNDQQGENQGQK